MTTQRCNRPDTCSHLAYSLHFVVVLFPNNVQHTAAAALWHLSASQLSESMCEYVSWMSDRFIAYCTRRCSHKLAREGHLQHLYQERTAATGQGNGERQQNNAILMMKETLNERELLSSLSHRIYPWYVCFIFCAFHQLLFSIAEVTQRWRMKNAGSIPVWCYFFFLFF